LFCFALFCFPLLCVPLKHVTNVTAWTNLPSICLLQTLGLPPLLQGVAWSHLPIKVQQHKGRVKITLAPLCIWIKLPRNGQTCPVSVTLLPQNTAYFWSEQTGLRRPPPTTRKEKQGHETSKHNFTLYFLKDWRFRVAHLDI
jgi:hypothetical protein